MTRALTRQRQVGHSIALRAHIFCQILALAGLLFANRVARGQDPTSAGGWPTSPCQFGKYIAE
jgi:hypothetical protein